jgi:hypothetical protein
MIAETELRCPRCDKTWSVKGFAYYSKGTLITFVKCRGTVKLCPHCRAANNIEIVRVGRDN